jgi:hypothetical protein
MSELGTLRVWNDPAISAALSWYLCVAENRRPAKFRIAATVATELDPAESSEAVLWAELDRLTPTAPNRAIRAPSQWGTRPPWSGRSALPVRRVIVHSLYSRKLLKVME